MGKCIVVVLPEKKGKLTKQEFIDMFFSDSHYVPTKNEFESIKAFEELMKEYFFDIEKAYACIYLLKKYVNKFIKKIRPIARSNC
ncbi:MAG: hypothetical protein ACRCXX_13875 [Cetobacterium sp.]|uniref:hypothetical protein n=1 Tax=Cetobacterium sp. TaxID=2071632 RepID=UPI003F2ADF15